MMVWFQAVSGYGVVMVNVDDASVILELLSIAVSTLTNEDTRTNSIAAAAPLRGKQAYI